MRVNLPVSGKEYAIAADQTLVSVTDLQGHITYCNPAFVAVSGYSESELLGQPHNIVRHPDMPAEAFRDMWATIQRKQPWTGLVKNRRKDGDHYWVRANATPMLDGSEVTGYLSVRTVPSASDIAQAEQLFATMRAEAQAGRRIHVLQQGVVRRADWVGLLQRILRPQSTVKVGLAQGLAMLAMFVVLALDLPFWAEALGFGLVSLLNFAFIWAVTIRPLGALLVDANHLAAGDLSHPIAHDGVGVVGQLQQALMQMSVNLRTVVSDVRDEVQQLTSAVREIAAGNEDLSARTETQASSLEQTAASMEEINGTIQQSSQSALKGAHFAKETLQITAQGNDAVRSVSQTMDGISDSSKRIADIIRLIEGVAFQTNILALNAAVEAARAGEQGRGFAVVASEVRSLAQSTAKAAKEIRTLITESGERIEAGESQTQRALGQMHSVLESVEKVSGVLEEVSHASSEQSLGVSQINEAIVQLDSITQMNAAMVEELAATAKSIQQQVESVNNSMRLFRLRPGERTLSQIDPMRP